MAGGPALRKERPDLSAVHYAVGKRDEAAAWVKRALEMVPGDPKLADVLRWLETAK